MLQRTDLAGEFRELGWLPIPVECPPEFRKRIIEKRSAMLANPSLLPRRSRTIAAPVHLTTAELRKQAEHIGDLIACDQAAMYGGFRQVKVGDAPWAVKFVPFGPGDWDRHLRTQAARLGEEIRKQREEWLIDEIAAERKDPTNVWDSQEWCYRPRREVLEKELDALLKEIIQ